MQTNYTRSRQGRRVTGDSSFQTDAEALLDSYLLLSQETRDREFPDTAMAARRAGVSQRTLELWIDTGKIMALRVGKKYRVEMASLLTYVRSVWAKAI